jgi:SAM-dependent methyltransferase
MGYQAFVLDPYSKEFIQYASSLASNNPNTSFLEVGCGFGVVAQQLLAQKAFICCNDISQEHLDYIEEHTPSDKKDKLCTLCGDIRTLNLPHEKFDAVLCSRVFHFFNGTEIIDVLKKISGTLKENGLLFIVTETPFLKNWERFIPTFIHNKKQKLQWPGIAITAEIESSGRSKNLPEFMNFFDIDTMACALISSGFTVEKISYIDRKGSFPEDLLLDGRESLGVIAKKI